jgi:hypothetical protein
LRAGLPPAAAASLARGAGLYQDGRFFEAHEAWEEEWLRQQGETKALLQGLILCAAALHKGLVEGRSSGCVRLLMSALSKLAPLAAEQGGVDVAAVRAGAGRALEVAHAWNGETGRALERGDAPVIRAVKGPEE